jgi:ComF family protein
MNTVHPQTNRERRAPTGLAWLQELGNTVVDLLFPPRCVACQRLGVWLCAQCLDQIEVIQPPICRRCGLPVDSLETSKHAEPICNQCQKAPPQLDGLLAYAFHGGPLREAIQQFKYEDLRALAVPLGELMADGWIGLSSPQKAADVIVPVPLHATRQRERGYNQASLLARQLSARLHVPVVEDVLIRTRATAPQVELSAQERRINVRDAFRCVDADLRGKRVLLIDDVCTTGSTLEAACAALRAGGATHVWAYTLARAGQRNRRNNG